MDHRRTVSRRAFVPPVWLIVVALVAVVAGAAGIGYLAWDATRDSGSSADASSTGSAEPSPEPTTAAPTTPAPTTEAPPPPAPEPVVDRTPGVSVLNGTSIQGLASEASDLLGDLGWPDLRTGDTGGSYPENTVYFPPGLEAQAQTLAQDLGITRVRSSVDGMRDDRLTVVLISRPSSLS